MQLAERLVAQVVREARDGDRGALLVRRAVARLAGGCCQLQRGLEASASEVVDKDLDLSGPLRDSHQPRTGLDWRNGQHLLPRWPWRPCMRVWRPCMRLSARLPNGLCDPWSAAERVARVSSDIQTHSGVHSHGIADATYNVVGHVCGWTRHRTGHSRSVQAPVTTAELSNVHPHLNIFEQMFTHILVRPRP